MNSLLLINKNIPLHHLSHACLRQLPARNCSTVLPAALHRTIVSQALRLNAISGNPASLYNAVLLVGRPQITCDARSISTGLVLFDQPSSKVEATVQSLKQKEKEKEKLAAPPEPEVGKAAVVVETAPAKKSLQQKIWAELVHYYHGFRLLFIDIRVCSTLLWRLLRGKSLTRREHRLLIRTTADLFRLLPFSVFIIVPFMELLLPLAIKLFPGMLPSTFQTATEKEDKMKQSLKVKLEMAKFLQKTLDDMAVKHKEHRSQAAKDFSEFFLRLKESGTMATNEEIIKFSKLFEDEITLDSLNRQQLMALCRVLEINTIGTSAFLRFQLQMRLRTLAADDRLIQKEGIDSLNLSELQNACRQRGMRAYGLPEELLKAQLQEWIDLSLNERVPPSLLLLSRALVLPENVTTGDKLKATISALPDTIVTQAKAAIGEKEGKIDNKTKIEIIKEEQRRIKEEREEQKEEEKARAEQLVDKAPTLDDEKVIAVEQKVAAAAAQAEATAERVAETELHAKDLEVLEGALESLAKEKKKLIVEKEEIRDLKEEIAEYQEDIKELEETVTAAAEKPQIKESIAAKLLYRKVNSMINKLDVVLEGLEEKEKQLKQDVKELVEVEARTKTEDELVKIDELMLAIKQIQQVPDDSRLEHIYKILGRMDDDHDGKVKIEDVLKVIEIIGKENIKLSEKQMEELITLMEKEELIETEEKIEKALKKIADDAAAAAADSTQPPPEEILKDTAKMIQQEEEEEGDDKHILKAPLVKEESKPRSSDSSNASAATTSPDDVEKSASDPMSSTTKLADQIPPIPPPNVADPKIKPKDASL